jgi:hypothetical protein
MNNKQIANSGKGISFCSMLTILFIGLKLGNVISWGWLWVLSPLWLPISIITGIWLIFVLLGFILNIIDKKSKG